MSRPTAATDVRGDRPRPWYRRPQALVGVLALLVPLGLAAWLIVDALLVQPPSDQARPDIVEGPLFDLSPTAAPDAEEPPGEEPAPTQPDGDEQPPDTQPEPAPGDDQEAHDPSPAPDPQASPPAQPDPQASPPTRVDRGPEPQPQGLTGRGSGRTPALVHEGGLAVFTMRHRGRERFAVALEGDGRRVRLADRKGDYDGSRAIALPAGEYPLEVVADGQWQVGLRQPRHEAGAALPARITGAGDRATAPFRSPGGQVRIRIRHDGDGLIVVHLLDAAGARSQQLVRGRGAGTATRTGRAAAGDYLFDVQASAPWTIEVEQAPR